MSNDEVAEKTIAKSIKYVKQVMTCHAYTIMESLMLAYERGECEFRDKGNEIVSPSIFGRSGDGFLA